MLRLDLWLINNILSLTFFSVDMPFEPMKSCEMEGRLESSHHSYRGCCSGHEGMLRPYSEAGLACCTEEKEVICNDGWHEGCRCPDDFKIRWRE